jgi:YbbR domain-containing protein
MKKIINLLLAASLFLIACNNNRVKDNVTITSEDGKEHVTINPNEMQDAAMDMQKIKEDLDKLTPLTTDELTALIPAQLMGASHSELDVNAAMGASVASADYKINDSTDINLNIIDCAGPGGAGIYRTQFLGMFTVQQDDEDEYTKTIDFNGGKAFENCQKSHNKCTLTYFGGGRFFITLEGDNVGIDELKKAAKSLNIK